MEQTLVISDPFYNYKDAQTDIKSIIHCINLLGENLVGAEIGVYRSDSFLTILQNCPNIKILHGVDHYKPYADFLTDNYTGQVDAQPAYVVDEKQIEYIKLTSYHNQKYSGHQEKIVFHEMDSNDAANNFSDESLDFIFIDTFMTYKQVCNDLNVWFPKVKNRGIFAGHDWNCPAVNKAVSEFRDLNKITNKMSTYDNTWIWYK